MPDFLASSTAKYRHPASGLRREGMILALVCGAQFMMILDLVVVNVALPAMQRDLNLGSSNLQWIVITYGLTFGGFLLLGGRAADLLGRRNVLVAGLSIFTVGSLGAGVAGSLLPLLAARAMQGLGAAMVAPAALSILTGTFAEGSARNRALGIFGGVAGAGACLGSVVGGILVDGPGWRWIFLINVPIGIVLAALEFISFPRESAPTADRSMCSAPSQSPLGCWGSSMPSTEAWTMAGHRPPPSACLLAGR